MKKGHNKIGTKGYGKFIDSFRKTKPQQPKSAMKKHRKKKLQKSDMGFQVQPSNKIRSKFSEADTEDASLKEKPITITQTSLVKALKGTPGYDQWLEKIRQFRAAHAQGPKNPVTFSSSHSSLLDSARQGDTNMMHHPEAHNIRDKQSMSILHHLGRAGKKEILGHPQVHSTRDSLGRSPLHLLAERNIPEVLGHPEVSNTYDMLGNTPLHVLAQQRNPEVLQHPDVSTVKNLRGRTPLHSAAFSRMEEAQEHPDFKIVTDNAGRTPFDIWTGVSGREPQKELAGVAKSYSDFVKPLKKSDPVKSTYMPSYEDYFEAMIEWPKGSRRTYTKNGVEKHGPKMKADYGYIHGTRTEDGEELDIYVNPDTRGKANEKEVYLLLQKPTPYDVKMGFKDPEEKWMLGFNSIEDAEKAYKGSMPSKWFDSIKKVTWDYFVAKVEECYKRQDRAKKVGLINLPESVKGTNCGNCMHYKNSYCTHEEVLQPVLKSQCCNLWARLDMEMPPDTTVAEYNKVEKAVGAYTPIQDTPGMMTPESNTFHGFAEFKKAQTDLQKELENLPAVTAQQGNKNPGPVYSFSDADGFSKSGGLLNNKNKKRLALAKKLKKISKANAFVSNDGFVARKHDEVPDTSAESQAFQSVKKGGIGSGRKPGSLNSFSSYDPEKAREANERLKQQYPPDEKRYKKFKQKLNDYKAGEPWKYKAVNSKKEEQYDRATNPFLQDLQKRLKQFRKSTSETGLMKYDMVNRVNRMKYNKKRLEDTNSEVRDLGKSIDLAVKRIKNMPKLVFKL